MGCRLIPTSLGIEVCLTFLRPSWQFCHSTPPSSQAKLQLSVEQKSLTDQDWELSEDKYVTIVHLPPRLQRACQHLKNSYRLATISPRNSSGFRRCF